MITLTDLSFNVWYDSTEKKWRARVRELPLKMEVTADSPGEALGGVAHHAQELVEYLDPKQGTFSTISALDWETALGRAKVTPNDVRNAIKDNSLSHLLDGDKIDRIAEETNDNGWSGIYREPFVDGFKRGVAAALKAEL
jgi:hypothetical protein